MKDLAVLVADKNMDFAMRGILARPKSIEIRPVDYEIKVHAGRDGGVRTSGPETLALLRAQFSYGLLMLDWDGSGADVENSIKLERALDSRLSQAWGECAKAIVIDPELESWVWGADNSLRGVLGWKDSQPIRSWLQTQGYEFDSNQKPLRPKNALECVMLRLKEPRSSTIYQKIASRISLANCLDPSFNRLKSTLQVWFPTTGVRLRSEDS